MLILKTQELFPAVNPVGKYLFFTRWTKENQHDIFCSTKIIEKLRLQIKNIKS